MTLPTVPPTLPCCASLTFSFSSSTETWLNKFYKRSLIAIFHSLLGIVLGLFVVTLLLQISSPSLLNFKISLFSLGAILGFNLGTYTGIRHWQLLFPNQQLRALPATLGNLSAALSAPLTFAQQSPSTVHETVYLPDPHSRMQQKTKSIEYLS